LSSDFISGIYQDNSGLVWLATRVGLNRLDPATGQITRYGRPNGLPADMVIGILEDDQGYLWLSTFGGLARFDPRTETFKNFDHTDGLNNLQYDFYAYHRTRDGRLWVGGKKGIDIVDPSHLVENPHVPPVVITDVEINNRPVPAGEDSGLTQSISMAEALTLDYEDRVVTFEFAALNFVNPQKNRYKYKLEGFDRDWVETGSDRPFATYTNLDPGDYVFRVIAANNDGVWNEAGASIRLTMTPAWWQTWWFYGLSAAAGLALFGFVYQAKANQLKAEKAAAVAIRESEEKYRVLFESFPLGIIVTDKEGRILETNARSYAMLGLSRAELEQRTIAGPEWQVLRSDGTPMPLEENASVRALQENRRVENVEMSIVKPNNEVAWLNVTVAPLPLDRYGVVVIFGDVSERKAVDDALRESEARLRQSQQVARVGHWAFDLIAGKGYWSEEMKRIMGFDPAQFINDPYQTIAAVVHPEDRKRIICYAQDLLAGGTVGSVEFRLLQPDGTDRYVWVVPGEAARDEQGRLLKVTGIIQDITERRQAERALQESEARYRELFENSPISLWEEDFSQVKSYLDDLRATGVVDWRTYFDSHPEAVAHCASLVKIIDANRASLTLLEASDKAELLAGLPQIFEERSLSVFREELIILAEGGLHFASAEQVHRTLTGQLRPVDLNLAVASGYEDSLGKVLVSLMDITARKQAEVQIRFQATLLDAVRQAVIATDPEGTITYFNRAAEALYGWPAAEVIGRNIASVTVPAGLQTEGVEIMERMRAGEPWEGEFMVQRRDGSTFPALVYNSPILDGAGRVTGMIGISTDITDLKQREKEHVRQQRLAAVGQLAAGIAHDFNNILTGIMGFAEILKYRPEMPQSVHPDLTRIIEQGKRAAQLTRQILDFSRQSLVELRPLDLKIYLNEMIKFLERTLPDTIQIQFAFSRLDHTINADPANLQHVITNLAVNARDAMPRGGLLSFDLSRKTLTLDEPPPRPGMAAGQWVKLAITDTGSGIAPEVVSHIFEPFFTTKPVGQGTGLGLAQVYGIVEQHRGYITVDSRVGQGTTFSLYFPALDTQAVAADEAAKMTPLGNGETILLVEDDPEVREVIRLMLETLNYRVLTAETGREALMLYRAWAGQIALVLTDAMMPIMDGFALAAALKAQTPELKVILMSGYLGISEFTAEVKQYIFLHLPKPLDRQQLAQALREALAGSCTEKSNDS
ncbi:MAG TPA: PAS domain S-box protein, partial [Anaerolineae bacterium]|nr:PAS domain S-box protein [Anaerolineae bacterium]